MEITNWDALICIDYNRRLKILTDVTNAFDVFCILVTPRDIPESKKGTKCTTLRDLLAKYGSIEYH